MTNLQSIISDFKKRANKAEQIGKNLSTTELNILGQKLNIELPSWYVELLTSASIVGLDFYIEEYKEEELSSIGISGFDNILGEMIDCFPGMDVLQWGFINFGACNIGTGDPIFINLKEGINPPVYRIYHDGETFESGIIEGANAHKIAENLSSFFKKALFHPRP